MEKKLQEAVEELSKIRKEKEHIQEELNEKERQGNSQDLVCFMSIFDRGFLIFLRKEKKLSKI